MISPVFPASSVTDIVTVSSPSASMLKSSAIVVILPFSSTVKSTSLISVTLPLNASVTVMLFTIPFSSTLPENLTTPSSRSVK